MKFAITVTLLCILSYAITMISAAPAYRRADRQVPDDNNNYKSRRVRTTANTATSLTTKKTTAAKTTTTTTTAKATTKASVPVTPVVNAASSATSTFSGDGTYYDVGLGSCGQTNSNSEFVAALNALQMANGDNPNNNPQCGKKIKVMNPANQKSVTVTIVDTCPPCAYGSVDLSPSAFAAIADLSLGRIPIKWSYV